MKYFLHCYRVTAEINHWHQIHGWQSSRHQPHTLISKINKTNKFSICGCRYRNSMLLNQQLSFLAGENGKTVISKCKGCAYKNVTLSHNKNCKSHSSFYWYLSTEFYYQNFCLSFPCSTLNKYSHIQIIYQLSSLYTNKLVSASQLQPVLAIVRKSFSF